MAGSKERVDRKATETRIITVGFQEKLQTFPSTVRGGERKAVTANEDTMSQDTRRTEVTVVEGAMVGEVAAAEAATRVDAAEEECGIELVAVFQPIRPEEWEVGTLTAGDQSLPTGIWMLQEMTNFKSFLSKKNAPFFTSNIFPD